MLDKITIANKVQTTAVYIFSKYMHCHMQFLVVKINAFPMYSKRCLYCCSGIKLLELKNLSIACIITLPYDGLQNGTELFYFIKNTVNVLHTFQKVRKKVFIRHFAFSSIQTVHVFTAIYFVFALQNNHEIYALT